MEIWKKTMDQNSLKCWENLQKMIKKNTYSEIVLLKNR